jgi:putative transcriptional regulator
MSGLGSNTEAVPETDVRHLLSGNIMNSLKGQLLVSSPEMADDDFAETVIMLVEHTDEGAYGLVLNQPTDLTVRDAWAQNHDTPCAIEAAVYAGGPCGEFLTALHTEKALANIEVALGIYYTQEPDKLAQLVRQLVDPVKFFVGFAGWGEGQLETELKEGLWLTTPASLGEMFTCGDELWPSLVKKTHGEKMISMLKIKHKPSDPSSN